jgi:acyl-coenzyme A synthetase/AMP-(fatty) acid ligase
MKFDAPIAGQSLTEEPKKYPWDRPPEVTDPRKVLEMHLANLSKPEAMDGVLTLLEQGMPIKDVTLGILRVGVAEGLHSPDVSLMVAPALHEFIKLNAKKLNVEYDEGFENKKQMEAAERYKTSLKARKMLESVDVLDKPEEPPMEVEQQEEEPRRRGLMERR